MGEDGKRFPLGCCIASIACTSLGLTAAVEDIQWGTSPRGEPTELSWIYVNVSLMLAWLVIWPAISRSKQIADLRLQWRAMNFGAIPAMAVAAFLSAPSKGAILGAVMLHASVAIFALGVLAISGRIRPAAALLPALGLAMPVAAFIMGDTFPSAWGSVGVIVPPIAVVHAARITSSPNAALYAVVAAYAIIGAACEMFSKSGVKKAA